MNNSANESSSKLLCPDDGSSCRSSFPTLHRILHDHVGGQNDIRRSQTQRQTHCLLEALPSCRLPQLTPSRQSHRKDRARHFMFFRNDPCYIPKEHLLQHQLSTAFPSGRASNKAVKLPPHSRPKECPVHNARFSHVEGPADTQVNLKQRHTVVL